MWDGEKDPKESMRLIANKIDMVFQNLVFSIVCLQYVYNKTQQVATVF